MSIPIIRELGLVDYQPTLDAMRSFTDQRGVDTADELWLLQHPRVFTQGQAGKAEHVLAPGDIRPYEGKFDPETRYIGVIAAYRDINQAQWKTFPVTYCGSNLKPISLAQWSSLTCSSPHCANKATAELFKIARYWGSSPCLIGAPTMPVNLPWKG